MKYFEKEEPVLASENNRIVLTSRRIRQAENKTDFTSIMLEKISSIEVRYQSWILILLAGIICIVAGFILLRNGSVEAMACFGVGGICILVYIVTRKHIVSISSDGGAKIVFATRGMSKERVIEFVDKVEEAKNKLISSL